MAKAKKFKYQQTCSRCGGSGLIACEVEPKPVSSTRRITMDPKFAHDELVSGAKKRQQGCAHGNKDHVELCRSCVLDEAAAVLAELHDEWAADLASTPSARGSMTELIVRHAIIDWNRRHIGPGRPIPPLDIDRHQEGDLADAVLAAMRAHNDIQQTRQEKPNAA